MPHRHMPGRIEDTLVHQDAARRGKVLASRRETDYFHGITET